MITVISQGLHLRHLLVLWDVLVEDLLAVELVVAICVVCCADIAFVHISRYGWQAGKRPESFSSSWSRLSGKRVRSSSIIASFWGTCRVIKRPGPSESQVRVGPLVKLANGPSVATLLGRLQGCHNIHSSRLKDV